MPRDSILIPLGYVLTLTSDAVTIGTYVRLGNPGGTVYSPVAIAASTVYTIGPFNEPRMYALESVNLSGISQDLVFSGVFTAVDDAAKSSIPVVSNGTEAANALTTTGNAGVITTSALTAAASGSYAITWTNTYISSTSVVMLSLMGGTNTVKDISFQCVPGSGTATLTIYNDVLITTALDGTIKLGYQII